MPVQSCESNGKPGYRWGDTGKCYTYESGDEHGAGEAKQKAFLQGLAMGDTEKMNSAEIEAARLVSDHYAIRVTKDASGDAIIAWFPFDGDGDDDDVFAQQLALPYGVAPEDLHLTLLYLGDPALYDLDLVAAVTKIFTVASYYGPCEGCVTGIGRFVGDGDQDIIVALCDVPWLDQLRCALKDQLSYSCALPWDSPVYSYEHGFLPHITLAYVPRTQSSPTPLTETIPFCIDSLTLAAGSSRASFDMYSPTSDMASADSTAYYAAREMVAKAGRVLSTKNHSLVVAAIDALGALHEAACDGRCDDPEDMEKAAQHMAEIEKAAAKRKPKAQATMYNADGTKKDGTEDEDDAEGPDGAPAKKAELQGVGDLEYFIQKSSTEDRYTFGPLYAPARKDAHDEYTDAETLQKALWGYVQDCIDRGDNRINLQHDDSGDATIGNWVEACAWPYETTIKVAVPGEDPREIIMPAGTVYMGVVWDERAWEEGIKKKRITGYSLGGRAVRVSEGDSGSDLPNMGDKLAAAAAVSAAEAETQKRADADRERELALASDMGAVAAERNVLRTMSDRLLGVLERHASTGVTINENAAPGLEALLEE